MMRKGCYDCLVCNLAMIISQYFGVDKQTAQMQARTLKKMIFCLRTPLGDSKNYYQHSTLTPIHGTGQGSCASPATWLLVSSTLMDCLAELSGGMKMEDVLDPEDLHSIEQWIDGFVNDTSLFANIQNQENKNDIILLHQQLSSNMKMWKELLEASEGKLELLKCFYYILSWKFEDNGNPSPTTIEEQQLLCPQTTISNITDGSIIPIQQRDINESHPTLGCEKTMIDNDAAQIKRLKMKSNNIGLSIKNTKQNHNQAT
jgi:hypothetical protein